MRTLFLSFICLFYLQCVNAQVEIGVKGGLNLSNFYYKEIVGKNKPGINAGLIFIAKISSKFSFETDLTYSEKGYTAHDSPIIQKVHLNYICLPLSANYQPIKKLSISFGLELSYLTKQNYEYTNGSTWKIEWFNDFDYGVISKLSYKFIKNIGIETAYVYGIAKPLFNYSERIGSNRVFQINMFYLFSPMK